MGQIQATIDTATDTIAVFDPSTELRIGEIADGGEAAVDTAVAQARETFRSGAWLKKTPSERSRILYRAADLLEQRADELGDIDSRNVGMARGHARNLVLASAEQLRYNAGWCTKIYGKSSDMKMAGGITGETSDLLGYTLKEPVGVAGCIVPWNGPVLVAITKLAPALAAGCSIVLKPAEETPLSAPVLGEILIEAGVPEGVVNIVNGHGHTVGAALAAHPDVDKIAFTGSTEVGKLIVQAAAGNLKKVMLELGGKSPVLIYDDADMSRAIPGAALGAFINSGQGCVCGSRVYAQRKSYDRVVEGLSKAAQALRLGGPDDQNVDIGPLISGRQMERVLGFIEEGRRDGVEIVTGGHRLDRKGYFVAPTLLTGVREDMRLMKEEIFGPVVAVIPFDDEEEVLSWANDTVYGLAAAVWTQDITRAHRVAKRLEAGTVWLNAQFAWDPAMPLGGYKQSGWGQEYGLEGVEAYMKTKSVYTGL
ncbi:MULTISPECIES: aldehyde dehydrogenase [unclassified Novosphingobium]|uniref:aldehyde dehydrogenase family protein n=1 Tax=unclassified Novosphingobium TaxID=2644732 RepID=UPI00190F0C68|nr:MULTISPECIES: aldehyde dehydrogenase family protein [unclassified Novosphingobium]